MADSTAAKGTQSNPYTMDEFENMSKNGTWTGGYVNVDGEVMYLMLDVLVEGYSCGSISGETSTPKGDFEFDSYKTFSSDQDKKENDDNTDDEYGRKDDDQDNPNPNGTGTSTGNGGHHGNTGSKLDRALAYINQHTINGTVYPNINRTGYINRLKQIINNPKLITQGRNGTCGIAVICKYLAELEPEEFAKMALDIYETGRYNKWNLEVSEDSKNGTDAQAIKIGTIALDCIIQGAFRNSYNDIPLTSYDPFTDGSGWNSITWPTEITHFFEQDLNKNVNTCISNTYEYLQGVDFNSKFVIALVISDGTNPELCSLGFPNHYVQIQGLKSNGSILYWQWGDETIYESNNHTIFELTCIDR